MLRRSLLVALICIAATRMARADELFGSSGRSPEKERATPASPPSLRRAVVLSDIVAAGLGATAVVMFATCMSNTVGDYADDSHPSCEVMAVTGLAAAGTYALGAPIAHLARGRSSWATSLALRVGLPVLGGYAMLDEPAPGVLLGIGGAMLADWIFLSQEDDAPARVLVPTAAPGAAGLALAGSF